MDAYLLEYEMKKKGVSKNELAKYLNIDRATLYRKLKGDTEFRLKEIRLIKNRLQLSDKLIEAIFFN